MPQVAATPRSVGSGRCRSSYWIETLGCPKNEVDSDNWPARSCGRRLVPATDARGRRPRRRQHLRVHRRRLARSRSRRSSSSRASGVEPAPASSSPAASPPVPGRSSPRPSPRSTSSPTSACRCTLSRAARWRPAGRVVPSLDLLELPRPRAAGAVGVREDRRGLRPAVRVLRDPELPWSAAFAADGRRSSPRSTGSGSPRSSSSRRTSRPTAATSAARGALVGLVEAGRRAGRARAAALPVPVRAHRRLHRDDRRDGRRRTSISRCSTSRARCCAGCGASATATASSSASTRSARSRRGRAALLVHPRLPRRDRGRPRRAARLPRRRRSSTGSGSSPSPRRRDLRGGSRGQGAAGPRARAAPGVRASCRTRSPRGAARALVGVDDRGARRRARGRRARTARRPRSTGRDVPTYLAAGALRDGRGSTGAEGPDLDAVLR